MKTAPLFTTVIACVLPLVASANPITVRSGEHETFTRLVMQLPDDVTWQLNDEDRKSTLTIAGFDQGFDLSRTFEIIPKTRLAAALAKSASLELQLNCDCRVTGFVEEDRFLVIDIQDADPESAEVEQPAATLGLPTSQFSFGELLWSVPQAPETLPPPAAPASELHAEQVEVAEYPTPEMEAILQRIQNQLVEAFSEAAAQGLVDPNTDALDFEDNQVPVVIEPEPVAEPEPVDQPVTAARTNIKITSSKDLPVMARQDLVGLSGVTCADPNIVDIASWSDGSDFNTQRLKSNQELYDELGRLQSNKIVKRAKLYLHFGMGAEAIQILKMNPKTASKYPELMDLAQYFEHGFIRNPRILHQFADCDSDLALWSVLSAKTLPSEKPINTNATLRGLEKLPSHLKYFVAQDLSARLLKRGELESAAIAIRSFRRLPESTTDDPKLVDANAEILRREDKSAKQMLNSIVSEGSPESPFALAALIDLHIDQSTAVPPDLALLAETYAFEFRNTANSAVMLRAHVLASASSLQFGKALDVLQQDDNGVRDDMMHELVNFTFSRIASEAGEAAFLIHYFVQLSGFEKWLNPQTSAKISARLLKLGFADEAYDLLNGLPADLKTEDIQLLSARILIARGAFEQGFEAIAEIESPEAAGLKAVAMEGLGNQQAAVQFFHDANQPEQADAATWLSEEWSSVMDRQHPTFGSVAQLSNEDLEDLTSGDQLLARTQAAIDASGTARDTLEAFLEIVDLKN